MIKVALFLWNVFCNSYLAFFTAFLLIKGVIFLFRVGPGRFRAWLLMIPVLKLPLDLFFYNFSAWGYLQGVDPLKCQENTRQITAQIGWTTGWQPFFAKIQMSTDAGCTFTLADLTRAFFPSNFFPLFALILLVGSVLSCVRFGVLCQKEYKSLSMESAPFVTGWFFPVVHLSDRLYSLFSAKEYEAVLSHEREHVRYRDPLLRMILHGVGACFFWIPTRWLIKKVEEEQEIAADLACLRSGVDQVDLVSALYKMAQVHRQTALIASHLSSRGVRRRLDLLMRTGERLGKEGGLSFLLGTVALVSAIFLVLQGRFWIF